DITNDDIFELDSSFLPIPPELVVGTALEGVVGTQLRINDQFGGQMGLPTVIDVVDDEEVDTALRLQLDTYNPSAFTAGDSFFGTGIKTIDTFNRGDGGLAVEARVRVIDSEENPLARGIIDSVFLFTPGLTIRDEIDFELLSNFVDDAQNDNSEPNIFTNVFDNADSEQRGDFEVIDLGDIVGLEGFDLTEFNNFRIEWLEDRVVWKVNDIIVREEFDTLPDQDMAVFLNTWANGFPEAIDDSLIPADNLQSNQTFFYDIGYVQVEALI
ncbi:MAG: family 16 glycosylhydrolase, partial [Xenococcus sp. (in: cyanobacteria)]